MILHYFNKKENKAKIFADNLYNQILIKSNIILKNNNFFKNKNYNTSFEIVTLFLIIFIKYNISTKVINAKKINEELIAVFISDLDESFRSKGIGDMSIGKYVKKHVKKFYFRVANFPEKLNFEDPFILDEYFTVTKFIFTKDHLEATKAFVKHFRQIKDVYGY